MGLNGEERNTDDHCPVDTSTSVGGSVTFQRLLVVATVGSALLIGLALVLFTESRRWGQQVTASNAIWYHLLAGSLWSCLGVSLILSVWGIVQKRWKPLALAVLLSGTFSVFAILSVGWMTLILTLGQIVLATTYSRPRERS